MRTVTTKIYKFSELSKKAKAKAIEHYTETETFDYLHEEAADSLRVFAKVFGIRLREWDFNHSHFVCTLEHDEAVRELTGQRLANYIWNNYRHSIYEGKYYGKLVRTEKDGSPIEVSDEHPAGMRHVLRHSRCSIERSCPFTGVCWDDELLYPIYEFIDKPTTSINFDDLLRSCIYSLCKSVQGEIKGSCEDDNVAEHFEINEVEFTKDGSRY